MLVTDLSRDVAGRFCTRLLALGGADVVSYPGRDQVRADADSAAGDVAAAGAAAAPDWLGAYLGSHKWEWPGDGADGDATTLHELVAASDVVVTSFDRGRYQGPLDEHGVRELNPSAVHVTTSSYGTTGPYAAWRGGSLADWAAGGYLYLTGEPSREPLCGPENLCGYVAGYTAAIAVQAASLLRQRNGDGVHVDVSVMAAMLSVHQSTFSRLGVGVVRTRTGRYTEVYPLTVLPCRDGYVSLGVVLDDEFDRLALAVGRPEILSDPRFATTADRFVHHEDLDSFLLPWLAELDAAAVVATLQAAGLPSAKVASTTDLLANPQLAARGFWEQIALEGAVGRMPGNPIPTTLPMSPNSGGPLASDMLRSMISVQDRPLAASTPAGSAPARAAMSGPDRTLPLAGDPPTLVLDLTAFWAGPSATRNLADFGARVIRVERPRSRVDFNDSSDQGVLVGHLFDCKMNRGKESVVLDLRTEAGKEAFRSLAARADVVVENYRAGVMDRLGLGYESLSARHPQLVYVSLSGFGGSGPWSPWRSYGPTIEAASSIEGRTGYVGGPPLRLGHTLPDGVGGLAGTLAALDGLRRRNLTGRGGRYDLSQLEAYCAMSGEGLLESSVVDQDVERRGNRGTAADPHGVYPCRGDDQWVAFAVATDEEWQRFVSVVDAEGLDDARYRLVSGRRSHRDELNRAIAGWTSSADKVALAVALQAQGIEAFPVATAADLVVDPQLEHRGYFVEVPLRDENVRLPGSPFSASPPITRTDGRPPAFGEHTDSVLRDLAGYSDAELARLEHDGVVSVRQ
jgi:crotonobetainyl-CoA:carnitine CoA-transferase CaiB-like acyl-CoA transferase